MLKTTESIIYNPYQKIEQSLPTRSLMIETIAYKNVIPDILDSTIYMRDFMNLYQMMLTPNQTNLVLKDIFSNVSEEDLEEELSQFMENDRSRYTNDKSTVLIKNHSLQNAYATPEFMNEKASRVSFTTVKENRLFCSNTELISNTFFEFIIDLTRPKNNYDTMIMKLPTMISRAMTEFVYLITTLFQKVKVIKHKHSMWFKDTFVIFATKPYPSNIVNIKNVLGLEVSEAKEIASRRTTTFRLNKLDGSRFTSFLVDDIPSDFLDEWNKFRVSVYDEICRYH